jgi:hypothetical protein
VWIATMEGRCLKINSMQRTTAVIVWSYCWRIILSVRR